MDDPIAQEKQAWDEYNELCILVKTDIRSFLRKGQLLKNLRDTERYKKLGDGGYETFNSFLNDPALKVSRGYAFQFIQMYDFYIEELHLPIEELEKIASIKLLIHCANFINGRNMTDEQALEVIEKAKTLSYGDFFKEMLGVEELSGGDTPIEGQLAVPHQSQTDQREIEAFQKPNITRCEMCNKSRVEYFEDQICNCDGTFHLVNKSVIDDYQHEAVDSSTIEGGENEDGQ